MDHLTVPHQFGFEDGPGGLHVQNESHSPPGGDILPHEFTVGPGIDEHSIPVGSIDIMVFDGLQDCLRG